MPNRDEVQQHSRRMLRKYLLWIAPAAGLFLAIGLVAIWRQQQTVVAMSNATLRSQAEQLASQLEIDLQRAAKDCLSDPALQRIPPGGAASTRAFLNKVRARHPVARFFIVAAGGAVQFPLVRDGEPGVADSDPARNRIAWAETLEMRERNASLALAEYRGAGAVARSDPLRALAQVRTARCLTRLNRPAEAALAWKAVAEGYPDEYDPYGRPYGVLAGLELKTAPAVLYRDLAAGRWEISADQLEYFIGRLGAGGYPTTLFAEHLEAARAFDQSFRSSEPVLDGEVHPHAFRAGERGWQAFYAGIQAPGQSDSMVAVIVDPVWLRVRLGGFSLVDRGRQAQPVTAVGFKTLLPFWEISVTGAMNTAAANARRWSLLMSFADLSIVLVFLYGLRVVVRDVWQTTTANLIRQEHLRDVSHGLKTPLSIIRLNAESMLSGTPLTDEERREAYGDIVHETEELENQISRMLAGSAVEDWTNLHFAKADLTETLSGALDAYCRYLSSRGIQVQLDLPSNLPHVRLDSGAVKHAVVNLMDNSVKYSDGVPFVAVRCYSVPGQVVCEVEDHGRGIPIEERASVFQRFYRGSTAGGARGAGLGLAVVQQIMRAHGGSVEVESEIGRGSRFRMLFPVEDSGGQTTAG